jgi:hypothetical protein
MNWLCSQKVDARSDLVVGFWPLWRTTTGLRVGFPVLMVGWLSSFCALERTGVCGVSHTSPHTIKTRSG